MNMLLTIKNTSKVKWKHLILDLLYPRTCITCSRTLKEEEKFICIGCFLELPLSEKTCESIFIANQWVENYPFLKFSKKGKAQRLIHEVKYKGNKELGVWLGKQLGSNLKNKLEVDENCLLLPVPLHKERKKQRGYNQAEEIAVGISETLGIEVVDENLVERTKATLTQARMKKEDRKANTQGVFRLNNAAKLENKTIIIVDDVITTGATVEALIEALLPSKPKGISIMTIASVK